jgi:hypothetical protein
MHSINPLGLRKRMCRSLALVLLAFSPWLSLAQQTGQAAPPSDATIHAQARLAKRRSLAEQARQHSEVEAGRVSLEGRAHPELFLPLELFNQVVVRFLAEDLPPEEALDLRGRGRLLGVTAHHWEVLAAATARLRLRDAEVRDDLANLIAQDGTTTSAAVQDAMSAYHLERCALLDEAYQTSVRQIGERFLSRLLYEVIAPKTTMILDVSSDADYQLLTEGLCQ